MAPDLVDGAENLFNICFDVLGGVGTYNIEIYVTGADGAFIKADNVEQPFTAFPGSIDVYAPAVGTIVVYNGDDVDPVAPGVQIDVSVTTDAVDGQTVSIPVNGITYTAVVNGGSATLRVNNFLNGPNTLIAQVTDQFCPGNIGYSAPLIADYVAGLPVAITDPAPGQLFTEVDDVDLGVGGIQINVTVTSEATDGSAVTITANGSTDTGTITGGSFTGTVTLAENWNTIMAVVVSPTQGTGTAMIMVQLDTIPPLIAFVLINNGDAFTNDPFVNVTISADDPGSTGVQQMQVAWDGVVDAEPLQAFAASISGTLIPAVPDGNKTVEVVVWDGAGHSSAPGSDDIDLDTTGPSIVFTSPVCGTTLATSTVVVSINCVDALSGVNTCEVNLDAGPFNASPFPYSGLGDGSHVADSQGTDNAGNPAVPPAPCNFAVSTGAITVVINNPVGGAILATTNISTDGTYAGVGVDPTITANLVLMTDDGVPPSGNWSGVVPVGQGAVTITVTGEDFIKPAGADSVNICVDSLDPLVGIDSLPCQTSGTVVVTGTVDGTGTCGAVTVDVNGTPADVVGAAWTATLVLPDGMGQLLTATATDAALNTAVDTDTVDVDTVAPTVTITHPTEGEIEPSSTVVVNGTVVDPAPSSGLPATITVALPGSVEGIQTPAIVAGGWTTVFTGLPLGANTVTASLSDNCGNPGSDTNTFTVQPSGFMMVIESPTGSTVVTVNGVTYGSVIATIPADIAWILGVPPYDTSGLTVEADGIITTDLTVTSPTTASGSIQVACNDAAGSFGTAVNVTISAYGVIDAAPSLAAPDSITLTLQLGEIGVEDVTVQDSVATFTVPVNVYYDSVFPDGFFGYDIQVNYDPAVVNVDCAAPAPVAGSDPADPLYALEFTASPFMMFCDNVLGQVRFFTTQAVSLVDPNGFFNVANINMIRLGGPGTSSLLTVTLTDFCNTTGQCFALGTQPPGYPWPVFPTYVKSGRVDIVVTPPPVIVAVDDDGAAPYDNTVPQGLPTNWQIYGSGFAPGSPVVGCTDWPGCLCLDGLADGQTEICMDPTGLIVHVLGVATVLSGGEIDTNWTTMGTGGPYDMRIENPDGQQDAWGPGTGDPGVTIFP